MADSFSEEGGVSPFPYVITVAERESCPDCNGDPWSRTIATGEQGCESCSNRGRYLVPVGEHAVATLEEARDSIIATASAWYFDHHDDLWLAGVARDLPAHGGTVTLPDGTEIQVTPYRWLDLAACANVHWEDTPECRAKVLDGFNARERVA